MLIKINECGSMFNGAIELIKEQKNIKTASKAAVEAILAHEGYVQMIDTLETMVMNLNEKIRRMEEKEEKTKDALEFLKSL
jgi:hypothetical protein